MRKILITGKNSYVGNAFIEWVDKNNENDFTIESVGMKNEEWKQKNLNNYDTIIHVAGIAHVSTDKKLEELYYEVNTKLTLQVAEKAKRNGVKNFVFISSMIVFGDAKSVQVIDSNTVPNPTNFYGDSKLKAEIGLKKLETPEFQISIIRPPMIYGENSKGNYSFLSKFANLTPIFPDYNNKRSMIHIDNFSNFLLKIVKGEKRGIFHPQNKEYCSTTSLVVKINKFNNKKVFTTKVFNFIIPYLVKKNSYFNKVFGNFSYSKDMSIFEEDYCVRSFDESILLTEMKKSKK